MAKVPTSDEVFAGVEEVLRDTFVAPGAIINRDTLLKEDLKADSLDSAEVVLSLEEKFGIEIPDSALEPVPTTVGDLCAVVMRLVQAREPSVS